MDSGIGNVSSLYSALDIIGYRVRVTADPNNLDLSDVVLLPGVGAFPAVKKIYDSTGLSDYIRSAADNSRPIIGICLGMQILTNSSQESSFQKGLGVIPGDIIQIKDSRWHIGWNTLKPFVSSNFLSEYSGSIVYFNHGFQYIGPLDHQVSFAEFHGKIPAIIKYKNTVGFQFHPEKSQDAGRYILQSAIEELISAK